MIKFCSLYSGSSGNSLFISNGDTRILIDAGISGIRIQKALLYIDENPADIDAVVVTHEHNDHSSCVGVMSRRFDLPVYSTKGTWKGMMGMVGKINEANKRYFSANEDFVIGNMAIHPFSIPHDANDPVGFSFFSEKKKLTVATDIGHMNDILIQNIKGSDLLMLESNHDMNMLDNGSYPYVLKRRIKSDHGHLCNAVAGETIAMLADEGVKRFVIGHLSGENNCPELAFETVASHISGKGFIVGESIELYVARRNETSRVFEL